MSDSNIDILRGELSQDTIPRLDGDINIPPESTLDEPFRETLLRDLKSIAFKTKHILFPFSENEIRKNVFRDWDLWGPLILCTFIALLLHHENQDDNKSGPQLSQVFALIWFGSSLLSFNFKMLAISPNPGYSRFSTENTNLSVFQLLCVFGYCLAPACIGQAIIFTASFFLVEFHLIIVKVLVGTSICFLWPTVSCYKILNHYQHKSKILLAMYPIVLFYFVLTWMIVTAH